MQRIKIFSIIVILWHVAQTETNAQDFWQQTNGPYGGSIRALAVNSNGVVFAGTVGAGIFRSSDDGETWIVFNNILSNKTITALAINSSGDIFAGVEYEGVYRSADDGESWVAVNNGDLYHETVTVFAMNSEGHIFAGTEDGILYTTDNGGYWATLNDSLANTRIIDIDINSDGYIFALTEYRILVRSIDAGKTWTKVKIDDSVPEKWVTSLAINADGDVFASTYYYLTGDIFQSKDNGNTWTRIYQGYVRLSIETLTVNSSGHIFAASLTTQIFSSEPPPRAFVYRSTDNGLTWETFGNGLTASRLCGFIGTTSGHLITGNNQGVFRSIDNGETWQLSNDGLINTLVHALAVNSNGYIFAGGHKGLFRSIDNGTGWQPILPNKIIVALAVNSSDHVFVRAEGRCGIDIFRSTDDGETWTTIGSGICAVTQFAFNSKGQVFTIAIGQTQVVNQPGLFRSDDNGNTWKEINSGQASALAINLNDDIFVAKGNEVYRSIDNGLTWQRPMNSGLYYDISARAMSINSKGHIFVGTHGGHVYRSTDFGDNWVQLNENNGIWEFDILALSINSQDELFASGVNGGVYLSKNNGTTWEIITEGLVNQKVLSFATNFRGRIFAGTANRGVFRSVQAERFPPNDFSLEQNYPNPFFSAPQSTLKSMMTIEFTLSNSSYVTLKVYNTLGAEVATLVAENFSAGKHQVEWNANDLPSGVYFYRLQQAGGAVQTKKLILIK